MEEHRDISRTHARELMEARTTQVEQLVGRILVAVPHDAAM
jgi:hypothetical protein